MTVTCRNASLYPPFPELCAAGSTKADDAAVSSVSSRDCRGFGPGAFPEFNARRSAIL